MSAKGLLLLHSLKVRNKKDLAWLRQNAELWTSCVAGALTEDEYRHLLQAAGFTGINIEVIRVFSLGDFPGGNLTDEMKEQLASYEGAFISAFIRARKP